MAAAGNMVHCQLWMGGLEPYMTESFILASFQRMGEKPLNVKVMRNKFTGEQAGYCFVHFENDEEAIDAMHKLNGKIIPNTNPSVRFRLNTATNQGKIMMNEREFSLWVGDLTPEVDDYTLYKTFAAKYTSIKAAKVILDASGYSKGFGFLRFGSEEEQKHCLIHMNGYKGLGMKPLKISNAIPKAQRAAAANGSSSASANSSSYNYTDYSQFYDPNSYWQNYSQWSGYGYDPNTGSYNYDPSAYAQQYSQYQQYNQAQYQQYSQQYSQYYQQQNAAAAVASVASAANVPPSAVPGSGGVPALASTSQSSVTGSVAQGQVTGGVGQGQAVSEESEIVEHTPPLDVDKENLELAEPLINFWTHTSPISNEFNVAMNNEYEKLNFIEVTIPPIKKKLENGHLAKKIVLSHACEMTFKDWEKRFEDKQKLSENDDGATWSSSSSGESEDEDHESDVEKEKKTKKKKNEDNEKDTAAKPSEEEGPRNEESSIADDQKMDVDDLPTKESGEPTVVEESVSPGKRKNDDESTEKTEIDSPSPKKMKLSENDETTPPMETTVPVEPPPQQDERPPVDRSRLFSVMADVDVNVLMADTESVSSKPTSESEEGGSDSSDGDSETEVEAKDEGKDDGEIVSEPAVTTKIEQTDETSGEDSGHDQKQAEESNSSELIDGKDEAVS